MITGDTATNTTNPALQKMLRGDTSTLNLRYIKDRKSIEGLADFINRDSVKVLTFVEPAHASIFTYLLEELGKVRDRIEVLHLDLWSNGAPELIELLGKAFRANAGSLLEISLRCRLGAKFIAELLPYMPNNLEVLDLSENILSDKVFLEPLMDFIRCSELHVLKLANCAIRSETLEELASRLNSNHSPISLEALEGIDLSSCDEIPKTIRSHLKDPPAKTRKDLMGYGNIGHPPQRDAAVQYLDYLKSALLMHKLVGARVRVWWPATSDESRSGFAGRFWPAKVLRVNPIDMILVVEYDNQEVDRVPCKFIQPEAPFLYGGGVNPNFLKSMFGTCYYAALSKELTSRPQPIPMVTQIPTSSSLEGDCVATTMHSGMDHMNNMCATVDSNMGMCPPMDHCDPSYYCSSQTTDTWPVQITNNVHSMTPISNNGVNGGQMIQGEAMNTGVVMAPTRHSQGQKRIPGKHDDHSNSLNNSKRPHQYDDGASVASDQLTGRGDITDGTTVKHGRGKRSRNSSQNSSTKNDNYDTSKAYDFIPKMLDELTMSSSRRGCDVYYPADLSHIATDCGKNVETLVGLDISFSGNILEPGDVCEFRDPLDTDGSDPSDYIGVIKSVNNREPLYKVICVYQDNEEEVELDSTDVRRLTMLPWHLWVSFVMAVERHILLSKRLIETAILHTTLSECLLCVKKRDPIKPFKGTPPNPLEMPLQLLTEYASEIKSFSSGHPRLALLRYTRGEDAESMENLRFQIRKQQQKIDALLEIYEAIRLELEKERDLNIELQAKLNCVVCFEKRINCLLNPCGHFNFCNA